MLKRRLVLATAGVLAFVLGVAATAWACTFSASVSVSAPSGAVPGAKINVSGSEFERGARIDIRWGENGPAVATVGPKFNVEWTIPPTAVPGDYLLSATQGPVTRAQTVHVKGPTPATPGGTPSQPVPQVRPVASPVRSAIQNQPNPVQPQAAPTAAPDVPVTQPAVDPGVAGATAAPAEPVVAPLTQSSDLWRGVGSPRGAASLFDAAAGASSSSHLPVTAIVLTSIGGLMGLGVLGLLLTGRSRRLSAARRVR